MMVSKTSEKKLDLMEKKMRVTYMLLAWHL